MPLRPVITLVLGLAFAQAAPAAAQVAPAGAAWRGPYGSILDDPATAALGEEGLDALYDMRLADAARLFERLATLHAGHPISPFLEGLLVWWEILPDLAEDDRSHDRAFFDAMERTLQAADRIRERYPFDAKFFRAAALGFRGRLLSNRGNWFRAARDGRQAMDLVFEIARTDTLNPDFTFGRSVYDYFAAIIPEQYPITKPLMLFFPAGNRERGLRGLERTSVSGRFVATEALYFLLQIRFQYEPDHEGSVATARRLRERHPANGFFHALEGRVYARWGRWADAEPILEDVVRAYDEGLPGYTAGLAHQALYFLGRCRVALSRPDEALSAFARLDRMTAGQDPETYFRVWGRLRAGMIHDRAGRRADAVAAYRSVLSMEDRGGAHERARRYLRAPYPD